MKFDRLPYSVDAPNGRLSPQDMDGNSMNCLALIKSPSVLKTALKSFTPRNAQNNLSFRQSCGSLTASASLSPATAKSWN